MKQVALDFVGMNNRAADVAVPDGRARNAVNVDFNRDGMIVFPRMGNTKVYSGTACHSLYEWDHALGVALFVDNGSLMRLNTDLTATTLATVGNSPMSYCSVENTVYYSNGVITGQYNNGVIKPWGIEVPPAQPALDAIPLGGLYAGDYRVAITWLVEIAPGRYEESGTDKSARITVAEGGGIWVHAFPTPPSYVTHFRVYVTEVNSKDFYLYDQFAVDVTEVFVTKHTGTIRLRTQFLEKVAPKLGLTAHAGRIYWVDGYFVRYTPVHMYHVYKATSYLRFEAPVTNIIATPRVLYVSTDYEIGRLDGIDSGQPTYTKLKNYGVVAGAIDYDSADNIAYAMSKDGFVQFSSEGIKEFAFDDVAVPSFTSGTLAVIENSGNRRLVALCKNGEVSSLQHPDYSTREIARHGTAL